MLAHWMKTVGEPESDWLLCWVLSLSQSAAGSHTRSIVIPLQAHSTSHTTSLASLLFYSNHHSTASSSQVKEIVGCWLLHSCISLVNRKHVVEVYDRNRKDGLSSPTGGLLYTNMSSGKTDSEIQCIPVMVHSVNFISPYFGPIC